jgi:hypothetical protein
MPRLMPVGEPKMEAHSLLAPSGMKDVGHGEVQLRPTDAVAIHFDNRTQNFSLAHTEMHGGRMTTVSTSFAGGSRGVGVSSGSRGGLSGGSGGGVRGGGRIARRWGCEQRCQRLGWRQQQWWWRSASLRAGYDCSLAGPWERMASRTRRMPPTTMQESARLKSGQW